MRLQYRIMFFLLLAGIVPVLIMGGYSRFNVEESVREAQDKSMLSLASETAKEIGRTVNEAYSSIGLLAESPYLTSQLTRRELEAHLKRTKLFHPIINDLTLLDENGRIRASCLYSFRGDWNSTSWHKRAIRGEKVLSEVHTLLYPSRVVMTMAFPVREKDGVFITGVLVGQIDMKPVWSIVDGIDLGPAGRALLVDRRGYVVASPDRGELLEDLRPVSLARDVVRHKTGICAINNQGQRFIAAHVAVDSLAGDAASTGWSLILMRPEREAYAVVRGLEKGLYISCGVSLAAILVLSLILSRSISIRLEKLVLATRKLGKGDFTERLEDLGGDEIGQLGEAFNWASLQLKQANQEIEDYKAGLERLVNERTLELKRANEELEEEIAERQNAEAKLASLNKELEGLVQSRTWDLAQKAEELEKANEQLLNLDEMKSSFLSSVSHEFRTPLTSVLGFAKMVSKDFRTFFKQFAEGDSGLSLRSGRIINNLEIIESEGERLTRLINELLDLAKIESGRMDWNDRETDPAEIVETSIKATTAAFQKKTSLELVKEISPGLPKLCVDKDRIIQVLINLLGNAVKFTEAGRITVRGFMESPGVLRFEVEDTGVGVAKEDLEIIFDKFHQVRQDDTLSDKPLGVGLGLSICKQIIEHYGGDFWLESEFGRGSKFIIRLPLSRPGRGSA